MKVLIVKMSSMGDILHTLPAITDAIRAMPEISFDWVVEENFAQIPTWHPAVHRVIPVAIRRWRKNWFSVISRQERYNFKRQLQQEKYDAVIDVQGLLKSAVLVTSFARGKKHGLDFKSAREPLTSWFYNYRHKVNKQQHAIERIRQIFAASLGYQLSVNFGDYAIINYFKPLLYNSNIPNLVFLHATTSAVKQWSEFNWRMLIKLATDDVYQIKLPWGTTHEYLRAKRLAKEFSKVEVLPYLTLTEIAEQLIKAIAVISVDTGLSHLAAALNCPNLTLYGPTDPKLIGRYGLHQYSLRAKDGNINSLTAEFVWQTFQPMLSIKGP